MKIAHIKINNILGIKELEFDAGQFNEIAGQNGTGKTSVLEAIKAVLQDGHDATLLHQGAERGEAVLVLDDGTELRKRVTDKASPRTMHREGGKVPRPAEVIKSMVDLLSVNPVDFLRAPKKDRVRVLLEAMPIAADAARLKAITGTEIDPDEAEHDALELIERLRKSVYDDRTGTNRAVKEKEATINQLQAAMPDLPGGVECTDEEGLEAQLADAQKAHDDEALRIHNKLEGLRDANRNDIQEVRDWEAGEIERIRAEARDKVDALKAGMAEIETKAGAQRERTTARLHELAEPIKASLSAIRANRGASAKREQTLATIGTLTQELDALREDVARQAQALTEIDAYKLELLNALPIPGLEVRDGEVFRDGIAFDRLNTAQQVDIAVEIAKLRAGDLKVCCVDGVELLDSTAFEAFRDRAIASGLQLFVSRVADNGFEVKTVNNGEF